MSGLTKEEIKLAKQGTAFEGGDCWGHKDVHGNDHW